MKKKKKSDSSFRKSRGGGEAEIFSPFRRLPPRLDVSPRDSFKGITPLAFPRQPRRRDWHSRRVLDPLADRRDTSTPRHLDSQHSSRETVDNGWPQRYILIRSLRNIFLQSLETIHFLPLLFFQSLSSYHITSKEEAFKVCQRRFKKERKDICSLNFSLKFNNLSLC